MLGIRYMKASPTTYVLCYRGGRLRREGAGLSFFYYEPTSVLVNVPLASADVPFVFAETTADFQTVTVQGQLGYRVVAPRRLAELLDFSVDGKGRYRSEDPATLQQRLVHAAQILTRAVVQRLPLREVLVSSEQLVSEVLKGLSTASPVELMGVEVLGFTVLSIRPTPEMARALEAEAREALQRRADEAIYARRNAAVEQERTIRESELSTEIAVEHTKRQIRETQMAADIAVEEQRGSLIELRVGNDRKDADSRAYGLRATLEPVRDVDWRTLMAVGSVGADPKLMIALAFRELAENAQKIGEVNISPDLLESLITQKRK